MQLYNIYRYRLKVLEETRKRLKNNIDLFKEIAELAFFVTDGFEKSGEIQNNTVKKSIDIANFVYESYKLLDPESSWIVNYFSQQELQDTKNAYLQFKDHEKFYGKYKDSFLLPGSIINKLKRHKYYRNINPNFLADIGFLTSKQSFEDNWESKGAINSFSSSFMISISPEIHFSRKIKSKLYVQGTYDRKAFFLNREKDYSVTNIYNPELINGNTFSLNSNDSIDLVIKQLSVGLNFATIFNKIRLEMGAGVNVNKTGFINLNENVNYGFKPVRKKHNIDISQSGELIDNSYITLGLAIPLEGKGLFSWLEDAGAILRVAGNYQYFNLASNSGLGILNDINEDVSLNFPFRKKILTTKVTIGFFVW